IASAQPTARSASHRELQAPFLTSSFPALSTHLRCMCNQDDVTPQCGQFPIQFASHRTDDRCYLYAHKYRLAHEGIHRRTEHSEMRRKHKADVRLCTVVATSNTQAFWSAGDLEPSRLGNSLNCHTVEAFGLFQDLLE